VLGLENNEASRFKALLLLDKEQQSNRVLLSTVKPCAPCNALLSELVIVFALDNNSASAPCIVSTSTEKKRSLVVVLPASMRAIIAILRYLSRGTCHLSPFNPILGATVAHVQLKLCRDMPVTDNRNSPLSTPTLANPQFIRK
jgi:hypothetical protein